MASWVTHLMIADEILPRLPWLNTREFCVGSIAPDCNVENEDWTSFTPPREITHWMSGVWKVHDDCRRFLLEYVLPRKGCTPEMLSFLLGYYAHLVTDAEYQQFMRNEERVRRVWQRISSYPGLREKSENLDHNWENIRKLIPKQEMLKDIHFIERDYLDFHPHSGFFQHILGTTRFPNYIDYLPKGAIARKIRIMGTVPEKEQRAFPFVSVTEDEYACFIRRCVDLIESGIREFMEI